MSRSRKLDTPSPSMVSTIMSLAKTTRAYVNLRLSAIDVAAGQDEVLMKLSEKDGLSVTTIAEAVRVRPSTVSKTLDRLEAKGLARRYSDHPDRRKIFVTLTVEGRAIVNEIRHIYSCIDAEIVDAEAQIIVERLNDDMYRRLLRIR